MLEELTSLTNLLLIASIILNITIILMISKNKSAVKKNTDFPVQHEAVKQKTGTEVGVVFCRNCGQQYESIQKACPTCKTARGA